MKSLADIEKIAYPVMSRFLGRDIVATSVLNMGWKSVAGMDADDMMETLSRETNIVSVDFHYDTYFSPEGFPDFDWIARLFGASKAKGRKERLTARMLAQHFFESQYKAR